MFWKIITAIGIFAIIFCSAWFVESQEMSNKLKADQPKKYESEWSNLEIEADVSDFAPREYVKIREVS
ncbi:hypothetical protein [Cytobacillus kochii]|uniref:hypothetical protein n=1 Tax=Cytobacillus kochii TaxID=859143 RepID=UPI00402A9878